MVLNVLELCTEYKVKHLVYASTSSVYGLNKKLPFRRDLIKQIDKHSFMLSQKKLMN